MKLVSYAGQQLMTTDDVAAALVELAAAIASEGDSQALHIPIVVGGEKDCADLIVGVGNDLLVGPQSSDGDDPDFSEDAEQLRQHRLYPRRGTDDEEEGADLGSAPFDYGLDLEF